MPARNNPLELLIVRHLPILASRDIRGCLSLVLFEPLSEQHLVALVVLPLGHDVFLHFLSREQGHILADQGVRRQ